MRIVDDVKWDIGADAYAAASKRFVTLCDTCGVARERVGFFGAVSFPGVSDLDALVVGDASTLANVAALHQEEARKSDVYGYLFWHEPLWVLEEAVGHAHRLHTMDGLSCADGVADAPLSGVLTDGERRVLNVAWLVFLLGALAEVGAKARRGEHMGLRLLLLMHKNLWHSMRVFGQAGKSPDGLMTADELRAWAKERCEQGDVVEVGRIVWTQIIGALGEACAGMDVACREVSADMGACAPWIFTRRIIFRRGADTVFDEGSGRIVLNPYAFAVAKGYLKGGSQKSDIERFSMAAQRCRPLYAQAGLTYPFLEPITIARGGWKKTLTLGVNRLADALCSVF